MAGSKLNEPDNHLALSNGTKYRLIKFVRLTVSVSSISPLHPLDVILIHNNDRLELTDDPPHSRRLDVISADTTAQCSTGQATDPQPPSIT